VIVAAAVCPHPLLMFRELGGSADPVADARAASLAVVRAAAAGADEVVVVSGSDVFFSSPQVGAEPDPLGIRVGRRLLADAGEIPPGDDVVVDAAASAAEAAALGASLHDRPGRTALLVMGDLSARRAPEGGPGRYDERAVDFDRLVESALGNGDRAALAALDTGLADELLVAGRAALQVLSGLPGPRAAEVTYAQAPYGVGYVVARWTW
jgi:aromatic ring-opening dioxygenase LigB subunit